MLQCRPGEVPAQQDRWLPTRIRPARLTALILLAGTLACGTDLSAPKPAASISAVGSASTSATVGAAVATAPAVRVLDSDGHGVAGATVTFVVVAGGGSVGASSATSDASGMASAGSWTLGTTAGENAVEARTGSLPAVRFTATGTAGAPTALAFAAGSGQTTTVGSAVAEAPVALVTDQYANPVPGITVTFSVTSGGGRLGNATAVTAADGRATVGSWTLGIATGAQAIRAAIGSLTASATATATVPAGCVVTNYELGATLPLNWESSDCATDGTGLAYDRLTFTTTTQQQVVAEVTGANGRSLFLRNADDLYVGRQPSAAFSPTTQNPMRLKYILAPGTYTFEPRAPGAGVTGAYTFSTTTGTAVDCDYIVFASPNVTFSGTVTANSCLGPTGGREQWINLQLKTGMKMRITLSNTDNVPILVLRDDRLGPASPTLVFKAGAAAGDTLVIDWTATFDTWHEVIVASPTGLLGKYTLKIEQMP
jgi:hypothetical protein